MQIVKSQQHAAYTLEGIHDGFLCGLSISDENVLKLEFKTIQGARWSLVVPGIVALKADNFRQGNIVMDVDFHDADACPPQCLRQAFGYNEAEAERYLPQRLAEMAELPWILVEIWASYGCELFALSCKSINHVIVQPG